jgi:hypothetical protein
VVRVGEALPSEDGLDIGCSSNRGGFIKTVITSFTEAGYEKYGKEFIRTFREFWPKDVNLVVYYEGHKLRDDWRHIDEVECLSDWMDAIGNFPCMSGNIGAIYKIDLDARMARKTFMQAHAIKQFGGKVFWIDADTITHSPVPESFLDDMLPDDKLCCFLGRDWYYTESGFIGFNADHPLCNDFFTTYKQVFISGAIFTRKWWHDCAGFDAAREIIEKRFGSDGFVDLAREVTSKHGQVMHPFINTALGSVLDHRKGNRKNSSSRMTDLVIERTEPYWLNVSKQTVSTESPPTISLDTSLQPSALKAASSMPPVVSVMDRTSYELQSR